jgi:hypothetical protein
VYLKNVFFGRTKPHVFSWLLWSLLAGIGFFAQISKGAGVGAWVTGMTGVMCLLIAIIGIFSGKDHILRIDIWCFIGALLGVIVWRITDDPLAAVLIVSVIDALAFIPTFRKAYSRPYEETASAFALAALKWTLGIIALESLNLTTAIYPASLVFTNGLFVTMLIVRRTQLHPKMI